MRTERKLFAAARSVNVGFAGVLCIGLGLGGAVVLSGQSLKPGAANDTLEWTVGRPSTGEPGIQKTTAQIMGDPAAGKARQRIHTKPELKVPWREHRSEDRNALPLSQFPPPEALQRSGGPIAQAPQPIGLSLDCVTGPTETGSFPPDTMGAVGPTQFIVAVNGRIRSFTKAGVADGVLNVNSDVFFQSVLTPVGGGIESVDTTDPQIRYDRLSGRWFITMSDVPACCSPDFNTIFPNRVLIAVSNTSTITMNTVWAFYFFQQNTLGGGDTGEFCDYPSLGIDNNALYIGGDMFIASSQSFTGTTGFVVRKSSILSGGPIVVTPFRQLSGAVTEGPFAPRGVDNYDPSSNEGYFIGVSNVTFSRLDIRRVSNPGGTPSISSNILLTVPTTSFSILVDHLGNTGSTSGRLDGQDDNLFAAHIRNGRLWTAHGNAVTSGGVSSNSNVQRRNGIRWYELNGIRSVDNGGVPVVVQSGTVFDTATNVADARQYWMPTVMVSGQGHAAFGYSAAGTPFRIDAATNGRLAGDTLGTSRTVAFFTASNTAYNPPGDTGGSTGRRWGDYSFTSLDPLDDMTIWTIQEYCDGTDTYGCQAAKLLAPPPATPAAASPNTVPAGQASVTVTIMGNSVSGSGFYDPGANLPPPAVPFNHLSASVSGGVVVNSTTYNSPTSVTLSLNTTAASGGPKDVTVTNPDGESLIGPGILTVTTPLTISSAVSRKTHGSTGTFDINLPLSGEPGLESRFSSGNHALVFTFSNNVVSGNTSVTSGTGSVSGSPSFSGNTMTVNLTGVTNAQRIAVRLSGVTDTMAQVLPDTDVSMNVLLGDVNANKTVNATDIAVTKSNLGTVLNGMNFRSDVNANGVINASDVALIKQNLGTGVP